jgi:hypothetical protein
MREEKKRLGKTVHLGAGDTSKPHHAAHRMGQENLHAKD